MSGVYNRNKTHCPRGHDYRIHAWRDPKTNKRHCVECGKSKRQEAKLKYLRMLSELKAARESLEAFFPEGVTHYDQTGAVRILKNALDRLDAFLAEVDR